MIDELMGCIPKSINALKHISTLFNTKYNLNCNVDIVDESKNDFYIHFSDGIKNIGAYILYYRSYSGIVYENTFHIDNYKTPFLDKLNCVPFSEFVDKYTSVDKDVLIIDLQRIIIESI